MSVDINQRFVAIPMTPAERQASLVSHRAETTQKTAEIRAEYRHELNVSFGDHSRMVLDIYYPKGTVSTAPVTAFVHGGGFTQGQPGSTGYLARGFVENGAIFVTIGYRLLPETTFPECSEDIERGLEWVYRNIGQRGGDPDRLVLAGHSAGAIQAAQVGLRNGWTADRGLPPDLITGLALLGGTYKPHFRPDSQVDRQHRRYVGNLIAEMSYVPPRTTLVVAEHEMIQQMYDDSLELVRTLRGKGAQAELFVVPGADHFRGVNPLADAGSEVFQSVRRMFP